MNWNKAEGNPPPSNGDCRKLVVLMDRDGMVWVGIRAYRHSAWQTGESPWWSGNSPETATVLYWMDLPAPPSD